MREWGENNKLRFNKNIFCHSHESRNLSLFSLAIEGRGQGEGEAFLFLLILLLQKKKWESRKIDKLIKNKENNFIE